MTTNSLNLREVTTGLAFPEGPVAMPDGSVIVVEIRKGCLTRVWPDGGKEVVATPGGGPNGAAIGPDGRCYVCNNGGFEWADTPLGVRPVMQARDYSGGRIEAIDLDTGEVEVLYTESDGHPLKGPNDIVFDAHGGFWFSDLGKIRDRDMDRGRVLYARADGTAIHEVCHPMVTPNGVGLSARRVEAVRRRDRTRPAVGFRHHCARPNPAGALAITARRPLPDRGLPVPPVRQSRGGARWQHLRGNADRGRDHGRGARRFAGRSRADARHVCDQHLLRRPRPPDGIRHAVGGWAPRRL